MRGRRRIDLQRDLHDKRLIPRECPEFSGIVIVDSHGAIRHEIEVQESVFIASDLLIERLELNGCCTGAGAHIQNGGEEVRAVAPELREITQQGGPRTGRPM